jgi:hypothetical protein
MLKPTTMQRVINCCARKNELIQLTNHHHHEKEDITIAFIIEQTIMVEEKI